MSVSLVKSLVHNVLLYISIDKWNGVDALSVALVAPVVPLQARPRRRRASFARTLTLQELSHFMQSTFNV